MDGGEGHFVAKFRRKGAACPASLPVSGVQRQKQDQKAADELFCELFTNPPEGTVCRYGDKLVLVPWESPVHLPGILRQGTPVGELRGNRLVPSHGLFVAELGAPFTKALNLPLNDSKLDLFLQGQELETDLAGKGYLPVLADGWPVGFGKLSGGRLKNHYPKGLRRNG